MRVIVAGSRDITDMEALEGVIKDQFDGQITEIVSGCARGPDTLGLKWAMKNKLPVVRFPADWEKYGKSAGYRRNREMAQYADALIALWDGKSKGTRHMILEAQKEGLHVAVEILD